LSFDLNEINQSMQHIDSILSKFPQDSWCLARKGWMTFLLAKKQLKEDDSNIEIKDHPSVLTIVQNALSLLSQAIKIEVSHPQSLHLHWIAIVHWEMDQKPLAYRFFLQSAKADPNLASNFAYIGLYAQQVEKDVEKAKKCFQKALLLDPQQDLAGRQLSDLLIDLKQNNLALSLFHKATERLISSLSLSFFLQSLIQSHP